MSSKLTLGPRSASEYVAPDMSMLASLTDMGFDRKRAERALIGVKNQSIDQAINYIYNNITDIEDEDQKMESTSTVPMTNEETVLAPTNMPTLMEEHRKLVKGGLQGDDVQVKEAFRRKLLEEEAAKREKERKEKQLALKALRRQMKQEKEERLERQLKKVQETNIVVKPYALNDSSREDETLNQPQSSNQPQPSTSMGNKSITQSSAKECVIQIRLPEGTLLKATLQPTQTLADVVAFIVQNRTDEEQTGEDFSLLIPFPRKEFMPEQFEFTTLQQAGLVPRGSLTVQKLKSKGVVTKGTRSMQVDMTDDDGADDDGNDMDFNNNMPLINRNKGHRLGDSGAILTGPDVVPVEGNEKERTVVLLCSKQWIQSKEEQNEDVLVFRPSTYNFPQTVSGISRQRSGMNFLPSGSYSESRVTINGQTSHVGTWKLRFDSGSKSIVLELNTPTETPRLFKIAALTDESLLLVPVVNK